MGLSLCDADHQEIKKNVIEMMKHIPRKTFKLTLAESTWSISQNLQDVTAGYEHNQPPTLN